MKTQREIEIQESVIKTLTNFEIYPFSVIFTYSGGINSGLLSITFFLKDDIHKLLDLLEYKTQCDKSGYTILEETNTILLSDMALINLYTRL
jgi:hypothetical protein